MAIAVGDYLLGEILLTLLRLSDVTAFIELMAATDSVRRAREARKLPSRALTFTTCMPQDGRRDKGRKIAILLRISQADVIGSGKLTCHPELLRSSCTPGKSEMFIASVAEKSYAVRRSGNELHDPD